jgi:hypothetical protein
MKKLLLLLFLLPVFLSSCTKAWMENRLEGTWRLKSAERTTFVIWNAINTGYENGHFTFNDDGTAQFTGNNLSMNGDWSMRRVRNWVNNSNGDDQDNRTALFIHLYDFPSQKVLNLEFDDMRFWGKNRMVAEYQSSGYRYKYVFVR